MTAASPTEPHSPLAVPLWLQRAAGWAWRLGIVSGAVILGAMMLSRIRIVVVPLLASMMIASVLRPVVRRTEQWGIPRIVATWIALALTFSFVGGALFLAGRGLTVELTDDSARWGDVYDDVKTWAMDEPLSLSKENVTEIEERSRSALIGGLRGEGANRARLVVEVISGVFLALAMTFFFIKDGDRMWEWIVERVAPKRRDATDAAGRNAVRTLRSYLLAVSLTGLIDAVAIGTGLFIIGVPLVIPLAVITFFAAFLPVVGATAAGILAATVALAANGPTEALLVLGLTLFVQQLEGDLIMPTLMGKHVPLHPVVVLVALTAGSSLAGIIGAFVAVPVAAMFAAATGAFRSEIPDAQLTV